ncbi:MAG: PadR family transcriptional regulator [Bacillota bacterium]|nr:PadR family transcriptional regulator [Bacillota bacterium]
MAFKIESSLLDACALSILNKEDTYGYEITQSMKQAISISESTLYPVLRRLQKEKLCITYDEPYQGRNRRYYSITDEGRQKLHEYKLDWEEYRTAIDGFLILESKAEEDRTEVQEVNLDEQK